MEKLDLALSDTVFKDALSPQQIAHKIGIGYQILINKVNASNESNKLTLREAWALVHATNNVSIFRIILEDLGYEMRRTVPDTPHIDILGAVLSISSENGDVAQVIQEALADGNISPREKTAIRHEVEENITALERLLSTIDAGS